MTYNYDYFISYAHKDNEDGFVDEFVERLQKNPEMKALFGGPPRVFYDASELRNMDAWDRAVKDGLATSRLTIVLLSPNYFQNEYCGCEFAWWVERELHRCVLDEGIAPIQIANVPGLFSDGGAAVPQELQKRFPRWVSELRLRQCSDEFDLREYETAKIDRAVAALCRDSRDKVWRQDSASQSPRNSFYPSHNRNFVGRRRDLRMLRENLDARRHVALYGLGGVGKTELALAYGYAFAWDYRLGLVYIKSENRTSLIRAILDSGLDYMTDVELEGDEDTRFATLLGVLSQRREEIIRENKAHGRDASLGARLLLILDAVNDFDLVKRQDLARLPDFVHVIATTRENPSKFLHLCRQPVDALTDSDALELLRVFRPFADAAERAAALEIIREFGGHTYRVEKIGAYLRVNEEETYQGFLDKARERSGRLREMVDARDFELRYEAVYDEESLRPTLDRLTQGAKTLLEWAALFGPDSVPVPWLGELANIDGADLLKALQELEDYRLLIPVKADAKERTPRLFDANQARLHRIVREIVLDRTPSDFRSSGLEQIGKKIDELLSRDESYWLAGDVVWGLDTIADFCFDRYAKAKDQAPSKDDDDLIRRFHKLFDLYLGHWRNVDRARVVGLASRELSERRADAAPDDPEALRGLSGSYDKLGALSNAEGALDEANEHCARAREISKLARLHEN